MSPDAPDTKPGPDHRPDVGRPGAPDLGRPGRPDLGRPGTPGDRPQPEHPIVEPPTETTPPEPTPLPADTTAPPKK